MSVAQWRNFIAARDAYNRLKENLVSSGEDEKIMTLPPPKGHVSLKGVYLSAPSNQLQPHTF